MTQPIEWVCDACQHVNSSGPAVRKLADGGEEWRLICDRCLAVVPVSKITARGVRLRARLRTTTNERKRRQLIEQLQHQVHRL